MAISSTAGIAAFWAATRADATSQAIQTAMLKNQAEAEQSTADWIAAATEPQSPSAPPGQGLHVDKQA